MLLLVIQPKLDISVL